MSKKKELSPQTLGALFRNIEKLQEDLLEVEKEISSNKKLQALLARAEEINKAIAEERVSVAQKLEERDSDKFTYTANTGKYSFVLGKESLKATGKGDLTPYETRTTKDGRRLTMLALNMPAVLQAIEEGSLDQSVLQKDGVVQTQARGAYIQYRQNKEK